MNMIDCFDNRKAVDNAAALKAQGIHAVGLYYFETSAFKQRLDRPTALALSQAGIYVVSIFEQDPVSVDYFQPGRGTRDAQSAHDQMQAAGQPRNSAVYFTVDYDAQPSDFPAISRYFAEVRAILRPWYALGCYGGGSLLDSLKGAGLIECLWLSQSTGFDGFDRVKEYADIVQGPKANICGIDCNSDTTNGHAYGWIAS